MMVCKLVRYRGCVQGVGFRYTARRLAEGFPVAGYVRNLSSGEVELVAEGESHDVQSFLDTIARQMTGYIQEQTIREEPVHGMKGFSIRH
jgi:acylphosphatase